MKKIVSMFLAMAMCLSLFCSAALAADVDVGIVLPRATAYENQLTPTTLKA